MEQGELPDDVHKDGSVIMVMEEPIDNVLDFKRGMHSQPVSRMVPMDGSAPMVRIITPDSYVQNQRTIRPKRGKTAEKKVRASCRNMARLTNDKRKYDVVSNLANPCPI